MKGPVSALDTARLPTGNVRRLGEVDPPDCSAWDVDEAREARIQALAREYAAHDADWRREDWRRRNEV